MTAEKRLKTLKQICAMNEVQLKNVITAYLEKHYDRVVANADYIFAEGTIPIALIAHMDTVFPKTPREIYYDSKRHALWSPQGLGADDRAGVYTILQILSTGLNPHVIFTTKEESGGIGAFVLTQHYPQSPFKDLRYIIELDRAGIDDCVFYDCANYEFQDYIESFGFNTEIGTFTDISTICPKWGIAGVNLSIGYLREHTVAETLFTSCMEYTETKVCKMLNSPPDKSFEYIAYQDYGPYTNYENICWYCGKYDTPENMFPVLCEDLNEHNFCLDCATDVNRVKWCEKCGKPFYMPGRKGKLCYDCKRKGTN